MQIQIVANTFVVTSAIKVEDIKLLQKYNPNGLAITTKEGDIERDVFRIAYEEGKDTVSGFGMVFGGTSRGTEGFATFTGTLETGLSDDKAKDYVAEKLGGVIGYVKTLETSVPRAAKAIRDAKADLVSKISVVGVVTETPARRG